MTIMTIKTLPLGPLLVEDPAAALLAADGVAPPQGEPEAAVAADVVHRGALGVVGARQARAAGAGRAAALVRGDLVGFARHGWGIAGGWTVVPWVRRCCCCGPARRFFVAGDLSLCISRGGGKGRFM